MKIDSQNNIARLRMSQGFDRKFLMWRRTVKYGVSNFSRNIWLSLAAILVMSFTLLTVFLAGAATVALNDTVQETRINKMDLALYMKPDTPSEVQDELKAALEQNANVSWVDIKSKDESVARLEQSGAIDEETKALIAESGVGLAEILPVEVSIHVANINEIDDLTELVDSENSRFKVWEDPNSYEKQFWHGESQQTIQNVANLANTVQLVGLILGGVFLAITILVIFNTIRLAIFARKDEIEMEKSIGAERGYVRGPFLVEAELYGIISGVLAAALLYTLVFSMFPAVMTGEGSAGGMKIDLLHELMVNWSVLVVIGMVLVGVLIGNLSARLSVHKYLHY
jgi:cell division transport system permease protein